jgi:putative restriction endonuclease
MSVLRKNWQRDESLLVLHLYCRTPFGRLHKGNPEIVRLAEIIDRTPSAVAMKAVNFAHLDPNLKQAGLSSVSQADRDLWIEFQMNSNSIALAAEDLYEQRVLQIGKPAELKEILLPTGPTESRMEVTVRRVQTFFRNSVMVGYENRCAISCLRIPGLLIASHIIPWKDSVERRADPTNGIALNSLYDRAFDAGLLTFDQDWRVCLSNELKTHLADSDLSRRMLDIEGHLLQMPQRFHPDSSAMEYHRNAIFEKKNRLTLETKFS